MTYDYTDKPMPVCECGSKIAPAYADSGHGECERCSKLRAYVRSNLEVASRILSQELPGERQLRNCDFFAELFAVQAKLQADMGHPLGVGEAGVKEAMLAAIVEAVEVLNEVNWKPWKKTLKEVDADKLATELNDLLQFYVNAALAAGLTPDRMMQAMREKWTINEKRIKDGY